MNLVNKTGGEDPEVNFIKKNCLHGSPHAAIFKPIAF